MNEKKNEEMTDGEMVRLFMAIVYGTMAIAFDSPLLLFICGMTLLTMKR